MYKLGIIGFGLSGRVFHAPLAKALAETELYAIASSRREEIAQTHPQVKCLSVEQLLADPSIDIVVVATPNHQHAPLAEQALLAGKHVLVEKPVALSLQECQDLARAQQQSGKQLAVYHNRRFDGDYLTIKQLLESTKLGRLHTFKAHFHRYRPQVKQRWKELNPDGGGVLYDLGAHLLDQALGLFGMPDSLRARVESQRQGSVAPDHFELYLNYPELQVQLSSNSMTLEPGPRYELHGELGSYAKWGVDPQEQQLAAGLSPSAKHYGKDNQRSELHLASQALVHQALAQGNYLDLYQNFVDAIAGKATLQSGLEQASQVIYLIELAMRSQAEQACLAVDYPGLDCD